MDQRKIKILLITITVILIGAVLGTAYSVTKQKANETQLPKQNQNADKISGQGSTEKYLLSGEDESNADQRGSVSQFMPASTKEDAAFREKYYNSKGELIADPPEATDEGTSGGGSTTKNPKKTNNSGTGAYIPSTAPYLP